ncbi:uncharacterized protein LOC125750941 isoform X2 [Brienomyrus brachyistius]|uniref:uncharacterized protein LOC125750941 isoform X2 n=1 Tax=Brienomyrus brachyistius TaxID=42636 RepID=UPI0020B3D07C|nr:uncharacterized protein LOC125750941 isoform X2 [Brienomyrus brachyistius]
MSTILGLFLIMTAAVHGSAGSDSDNKTHHVALGRPAFIQLINGAGGYQLTLKKDGNNIFIFKKDKTIFHEKWESQFNFYTNGTLMIIKAERSLSGIYTLEIFDSDGKALPSERFLLTIEEPVTPPALSSVCLPHGELRVSCSSAGDNPQYSWLLDGLFLNNSRPVYDDGKGAIILGKNTSGSLTCTAKNNVSEEKAAVTLPNCAGLGPVVNCTLTNGTEIAVRMNATVNPSLLYNMKIFFTVDGRETLAAVCNASSQQTGEKNDNHFDMMPMLFVALGTVVLLLILTVGLYSYCRKRPHVQAEEIKPDTEEMTYAQVTFNRKKSRREKRAEPEVVYGEVRV